MVSKYTKEDIEKLADKLQSQGPDEFPRGYYRWLAEEKLKGK